MNFNLMFDYFLMKGKERASIEEIEKSIKEMDKIINNQKMEKIDDEKKIHRRSSKHPPNNDLNKNKSTDEDIDININYEEQLKNLNFKNIIDNFITLFHINGITSQKGKEMSDSFVELAASHEQNSGIKNLKAKEDNNIKTSMFTENQHPRNEPKEKPERNTNGTYISQVYCSSYNNINGQPKQECYQAQSIKQMNEGHNISEAREAYKNSDGVMKSAYQRGLDEKGARFIKEKNTKTGKKGQHKVLKGIKENEIDGFNKEYDAYSKKCGFKKNYKALNGFDKNNNKEVKQIGY